MLSWYILIGLIAGSGLILLGMVYFKRWQLNNGKGNVSFHHVPISHIHEYSLFLNKASAHVTREALVRYAAKAYVSLRFVLGRIKGYVRQTRAARRAKMMVDQVRGKEYLYSEGNKTSEFLRAIAEHKQKIRNGQ